MEGYEVITYDDEKVGTVAEESGDYLIVEHGSIRKSKRALPRQFAHSDDEAQQVRMPYRSTTGLRRPRAPPRKATA